MDVVANPEWGKVPYRSVDVDRYIGREHVTREFEAMWMHTWQMACREEEIAEPGAYFEYEIGDQSIVIVRTQSNELRAYFNACPHRGTQLLKGCGKAQQIVCPFHGWRWSLEGESRYVHDRAEFPNLSDDELALPQAQVGACGGFVFVRLDEEGPALADYLEPVASQLAPYKLDEYRIRLWKQVGVPCNWKTALEAFEETYHTMKTHPQIMKGMDDVGVIYELLGLHSRMIVTNAVASARYKGRVKEKEVLQVSLAGLLDFGLASEAEREMLEEMGRQPLPEGQDTRDLFRAMSHGQYGDHLSDLPLDNYMKVYHYTIFPNLAFNLMPGNFLGLMARPDGDNPDSCVFDVICLQHPCDQAMESAPRQVITDPDHDWGVVMAQDMGNFGRVQQGMHSRRLKRTRLAGYQEMRISNRIERIDDFYEKYGQ